MKMTYMPLITGGLHSEDGRARNQTPARDVATVGDGARGRRSEEHSMVANAALI